MKRVALPLSDLCKAKTRPSGGSRGGLVRDGAALDGGLLLCRAIPDEDEPAVLAFPVGPLLLQAGINRRRKCRVVQRHLVMGRAIRGRHLAPRGAKFDFIAGVQAMARRLRVL